MVSVSISHSQYDKQITIFFKRTIENIGLEPILIEYEDLTHQNVGVVIKTRIMSNDCKCLIVLSHNQRLCWKCM
jgi:hypothetical protein